MDAVFRAAAIYLVMLVLFKVAGRRSLSDLTTFDLVLLMIIGEATQQALLGDDFSVTNAVLVIGTLIAIDVGLSLLKDRSARVARMIDGSPTILIENGKVLEDRLRRCRLRLDDIMEIAREKQGLETLQQIKFAIIERNGKVSIVPAD